MCGGYTIALDDFGTGYSSLSYLDQLPIDIIKIDRSFIDKISNEDVQAPMVEAIIQLARILGLEIVAEGIETEGQRKALERMGCEFSQGFLFSKPVDGDDLIALIKVKQLCGGTE